VDMKLEVVVLPVAATVSGLDGNGWLLQEVTGRLPGRVGAAETPYASGTELAGAMRRAPAAGGARENRIGAADRIGPAGAARTWRPIRPGRSCRDGRL
jgi:hypothetical protein